MGKNPFKLAGLPGGICVTMLPLSLRLDCEQSLFSSETVGKTQTKRGSVTVTVAALSVASGSRYRRSYVTLTVTLARLLILCSSPQIFDEKRDRSQSSLRLKSDVTKLVYFD